MSKFFAIFILVIAVLVLANVNILPSDDCISSECCEECGCQCHKFEFSNSYAQDSLRRDLLIFSVYDQQILVQKEFVKSIFHPPC
jgi:hypothetical protein